MFKRMLIFMAIFLGLLALGLGALNFFAPKEQPSPQIPITETQPETPSTVVPTDAPDLKSFVEKQELPLSSLKVTSGKVVKGLGDKDVALMEFFNEDLSFYMFAYIYKEKASEKYDSDEISLYVDYASGYAVSENHKDLWKIYSISDKKQAYTINQLPHSVSLEEINDYIADISVSSFIKNSQDPASNGNEEPTTTEPKENTTTEPKEPTTEKPETPKKPTRSELDALQFNVKESDIEFNESNNTNKIIFTHKNIRLVTVETSLGKNGTQLYKENGIVKLTFNEKNNYAFDKENGVRFKIKKINNGKTVVGDIINNKDADIYQYFADKGVKQVSIDRKKIEALAMAKIMDSIEKNEISPVSYKIKEIKVNDLSLTPTIQLHLLDENTDTNIVIETSYNKKEHATLLRQKGQTSSFYINIEEQFAVDEEHGDLWTILDYKESDVSSILDRIYD